MVDSYFSLVVVHMGVGVVNILLIILLSICFGWSIYYNFHINHTIIGSVLIFISYKMFVIGTTQLVIIFVNLHYSLGNEGPLNVNPFRYEFFKCCTHCVLSWKARSVSKFPVMISTCCFSSIGHLHLLALCINLCKKDTNASPLFCLRV